MLAFLTTSALALYAPRALEVTQTVELGTSGDFVILAKAGISTVPDSSTITGNIAVSPIAATAITGFVLTADSSNEFSTSTQVTGKCYAADYTAPTPTKLTTAVGDGELAYTNAAARATSSPDEEYLDLATGGLIDGQDLTAGVYSWGTGVSINGGITITGSEDDIFIFQIAGNLIAGDGAQVNVVGAQTKNIFWQVAGFVEAGTGSHLEGNLLVKEKAVFKTGSSLKGRLFAQTAVTLASATITAA